MHFVARHSKTEESVIRITGNGSKLPRETARLHIATTSIAICRSDLLRSKYLGNDQRSHERHSWGTSAFVVTGAPIAIMLALLDGNGSLPITIRCRKRRDDDDDDDDGRIALCKSDLSPRGGGGNSEFLLSPHGWRCRVSLCLSPPPRWKKLPATELKLTPPSFANSTEISRLKNRVSRINFARKESFSPSGV